MPPLLLAQGQTGNDALSMFVLLLCVIFAVFALWVALVSGRTYRSDFMALGANYECGAEPLAERVSAGDALAFFKVVCIFWVFEWEIAVLFVTVPLLGICGGTAVLTITAFVLLVELGILAELRSGSTLFNRVK